MKKISIIVGASILSIAVLILGFQVLASALAFVTCDHCLIATIDTSKIGEPGDRIDAFVPDGHRDQYWFVRFSVLRSLKGRYPEPHVGVRLHSPALQFGIREKPPAAKRYILFFRRARVPDGSTVLLLVRQLRIG